MNALVWSAKIGAGKKESSLNQSNNAWEESKGVSDSLQTYARWGAWQEWLTVDYQLLIHIATIEKE